MTPGSRHHWAIKLYAQRNWEPNQSPNAESVSTRREDACRVRELKSLVNLTGSFCISWLENISNSDEAMEAELSNKKYHRKLQLRWGGCPRDGSDAEDEILECLQPHIGKEELDKLFFNGTKLRAWISNSSFTEIVSISLFQIPTQKLLSAPSIGRLPSLRFVEIYDMSRVRVIDHSFYRNEGGQEFDVFPRLEKLTLHGMLNLQEWSGVGDGDFPSLQQFKLKYFPKLLTVPFLSKLQILGNYLIYCAPIFFLKMYFQLLLGPR